VSYAKRKIHPSKLWAVYAKTEEGIWDEVDFAIHFRDLKWVLRNNHRTRLLKTHGYDQIVFTRVHWTSIWMFGRNGFKNYKMFFTPERVHQLENLMASKGTKLKGSPLSLAEYCS